MFKPIKTHSNTNIVQFQTVINILSYKQWCFNVKCRQSNTMNPPYVKI